MPVIFSHQRGEVSPPEWSDIAHWGISRQPAGKEIELHYHDTNEYWVIIEGRGTCTTEGDTYEIGPGDVVLTKGGDEHALVVTESMVAVYIYGRLGPGDTLGHKHKEHSG